MEGIIRNFGVIKVICHLLMTALWLYWGICIHPLTTGWGWCLLIGGGILYFILGGVFLGIDGETNDNDNSPWWALGYGFINLLPLFYMFNFTAGLYPSNPSILICPVAYSIITMILYGFSSFGASYILSYLMISIWISNWVFDRWYDYCILIASLLVASISIIVSTLKNYEEAKSEVLYWLINFGISALLNVGLFSLLYFKGLFNLDNMFNIVYLITGIFLFLLVISTRLITSIITFIAIALYWYKYSDFSVGSLIPDISFEWVHSIWFIYTAYIVGGICVLGLIIFVIYRLLPSKVVYTDRYTDRDHKLPMIYNGLSMTCPSCQKTIVKGEYSSSAARGIIKTTTKGAIGGVSVVGAFWAGATVGGPFALLTGAIAAVGAGALNYYTNKKIDRAIDWAIDKWNYEVDGGRTVYFKCPRHECGHEWEETEHYGEIDH